LTDSHRIVLDLPGADLAGGRFDTVFEGDAGEVVETHAHDREHEKHKRKGDEAELDSRRAVLVAQQSAPGWIAEKSRKSNGTHQTASRAENCADVIDASLNYVLLR